MSVFPESRTGKIKNGAKLPYSIAESNANSLLTKSLSFEALWRPNQFSVEPALEPASDSVLLLLLLLLSLLSLDVEAVSELLSSAVAADRVEGNEADDDDGRPGGYW